MGVMVAFLVVAIVVQEIVTSSEPPGIDVTGGETVSELFADQRSGEMVTVDGTVERTLADDNEGSRHQRFIIRLANGLTLLVAHNLDLAERVPLEVGDNVRIRGEYEWNPQGGVLHWTHHDPVGQREGGWIEHAGERYR